MSAFAWTKDVILEYLREDNRPATQEEVERLLSFFDVLAAADTTIGVALVHYRLAEKLRKQVLIERAIAHCQTGLTLAYHQLDWQLSVRILVLLGNIYLDKGYFNLSLKQYLEAMAICQSQQLDVYHSIVLNNVGEIYYKLADYTRAMNHFIEAYQKLKQSSALSPLKHRAQFIVVVNLVVVYLHLNRYFEALSHADLLPFYADKVDRSVYRAYYSMAQLNVALYLNDQQGIAANYETTKASLLAIQLYALYLRNVIGYAQYYLNQHAYDSYIIAELNSLDKPFYRENYTREVLKVYAIIAEYYHHAGDTVRALAYHQRHYQLFLQLNQAVMIQQSKLVEFRMDVEFIRTEHRLVGEKNTRLQHKKEEALQKQHALKQLNQHLSIINRLGRQLTSTLDIDQLVHYIFSELNTHMPMDDFHLFIVRRDTNEIIPNSRRGTRSPGISIDDPHCIVARVLREHTYLFSNHLSAEYACERQMPYAFIDEQTESLMILPVDLLGEVVALCAIQSAQRDAYQVEHLSLFRALMPFVGLSIKNSRESRQLIDQIVQREKAQQSLAHYNQTLKLRSEIDGLTNVPNRRCFQIEYQALYTAAIEQKLSICAMMVDIDFFKMYNDYYGHLMGDKALINVAAIIKRVYRKANSAFARFGGEEFILAFVGISHTEALSIAERFRKMVQHFAIEHERSPFKVITVSIGIAYCRRAAEQGDLKLIAQADDMLYRAKNSGRNKVVIND